MSAYPNPCPKCGAAPYKSCRTLTTGRVTDTHLIRIEQRAVWRKEQP